MKNNNNNNLYYYRCILPQIIEYNYHFIYLLFYLNTGAPPAPAGGRTMLCSDAYTDNRATKAGEPITTDKPYCLIVFKTTAGSLLINLGIIATSVPTYRYNNKLIN